MGVVDFFGNVVYKNYEKHPNFTRNFIKFCFGLQKKMLEKYAKEQGFTNLDHYTDVYNQRLIPFDTKMAVQTPKITAFEGKRDCRKPLFLFWGFM